MRHRRLLAAAVLAATLGLGGVAAAGALDGESAPAGATGPAAGGTTVGGVAAAPGAATAPCDRLTARVAEVPGIRARIETQLAAIEERLEAARSPVLRERLRTRLQPRIDALTALDQRLADQVARVEARCPDAA